MLSLRRFPIYVFAILSCFALASCSTSSTDQGEDSSKLAESEGLSESDLFKIQISDDTIQQWGLINHEERIFFIKAYSDEKRNYQSQEVESVIPDYCMPVASLLSDTKKSEAKYFLQQSLNSTENFDYFGIEVKAFESASLARDKFDLLVANSDKCGAWLPKYTSGETGIELDLWEKLSTKTPDYIAWENEKYDEAGSVGLVGSTVYVISVSVDGRMEKSKSVRETANTYVGDFLRQLQE